jgi:hypothetical protein
MKRTNSPSPASKNDSLDRIVAELGPDVLRKLHRAYKLTAAAVYRRAVEEADAQLHERRHPLR